MDDQDRVSQASSMATVSSLPLHKSSGGEKVQTFGKRFRSSKRDPNCPVVIRGWLNKKDSAGLKLWKRRWFVLSNYCLFYYKDSREEFVLGSIPLPSYNILFCSSRECRNRKYTFKVVHQGMRSYFFSADTQEDMLGWVRALGQAAAMEQEGTLNRRCCSYQDFSQLGGSSESVASPSSEGDGFFQKPRHVSRTLSEPTHLTGGRAAHAHAEQRDRRPSPSPSRDRYGLEDAASCGGSLTPRGQLGSRPHTPVGRVDIRPQNDPFVTPQPLFYTPPSPKHQIRPHPPTPVLERWLNKPVATYGSVHHGSSGRRSLAKSHSTGGFPEALPPLPRTTRVGHVPHPTHHHHHHHHGNHVSVCVVPTATPAKPELRDTPPLRPLESEADAVLTRLCGCDKLLQALSMELAQLQVDKISVAVLQDSVQVAMEMGRMQVAMETSRMQLEEWRTQDAALTQKALLQDELVTIRARMCDVSLEMERVWSQYERMESELSIIRSHLQHITDFGSPQNQSQAQRDLWMMEDVLSALKPNRDHHAALLRLHTLVPSAGRELHTHSTLPPPPPQTLQTTAHMGADLIGPTRPPLPQEHQKAKQMRAPLYDRTDLTYESSDGGRSDGRSQAGPVGGLRRTPDSTIMSHKGVRMGEEEQMRTWEKQATRKKPPMMPCGPQRSKSSEPRNEAPFPLRVTRVVTATLPSSLVARRVAVDDPPPELSAPLQEQIRDPRTAPRPPAGLEPAALRHRAVSRESTQRQTENGARDGGQAPDTQAQGPHPRPLNPSLPLDGLTPEQREAKLRRVQRIRERVVRSAVRESSITPVHLSVTPDTHIPLLTDDRKLASQTPGVCYHSDGPAEHWGGEEEAEPGSHLQPPEGVEQQESRRRNGAVKHSSSVTWYQREDGRQVSPDRFHGDRSQSSRAQWFLSTNQWQGFIPLQSQALEPLCDQEVADITSRPDQPEPMMDAGDASPSSSSSSSHVSHLSLEKMKENHALFYQIACDVSISDTDVTPGDHNGNDVNDGNDGNNVNNNPASLEQPEEEVQISGGKRGSGRSVWDALVQGLSLNGSPTPSKKDEDPEEHRVLDESEALSPKVLPDVSSSTSTTTSTSSSSSSSQQDLTHRIQGKERRGGKEVEDEETSHLGDEPGRVTKTSEEDTFLEEVKRDQAAVRRHQEEGQGDQEGRRRDQEQTRVFRKSSSLSDSREAVSMDSGNGDVTTVLRGGGFGNTRVTVLRTSL